MEIVIDLDHPDPMFTQLVRSIKQSVQQGALRAGDPLPSIRQLATDLELNSKTVAKAYRLLERDSVIQTRGYRGTFVHPKAVANSKVDLQAKVQRQLTELVAGLRESGATDSEIRIAFAQSMAERNS